MMEMRTELLRRHFVKLGAISAAMVMTSEAEAVTGSDWIGTFSDVVPNTVISVLVPAGWTVGKLITGTLRIAHNPTVILYGGIAEDRKLVVGELCYMETPVLIDAPATFANLTAERQGARLVYSALSAGTPQRGVYTQQYLDRDHRALFERIDIYPDIAFSLLIGSNGDVELDAVVRRILVSVDITRN